MKKETMRWGVIFVLLIAVTYMPPVQAGQLEPPPGEPGPTMHTLEDIYRQLSILNKRTAFINNETCWNAGYRYCDQQNGTVVDLSTGLVWMQDASFSSGNYEQAVNFCSNLADGIAGLEDGSAAGDWRLPTKEDFGSLKEPGNSNPVLHWSYEFAFIDVILDPVDNWYWTSSQCNDDQSNLFSIMLGNSVCQENWMPLYYIWCVK